MDASAYVDNAIGKKTSSAYLPPELASRKFNCECGGQVQSPPCLKCEVQQAKPSFDVWSLGVILFELCAGRTLFAQDINNDELVEASDKTRLCVWQTISDDELSPVLKDAYNREHMSVDMQTVNAAKSLIRWCLKGDPAERPTVEEILGHAFLNPESSIPLVAKPMKYFGFLSHAQADASGTVAALYLLYQQLGLHCWVDMRQEKLTLEGMREGVRDSSVFILILTEHVLGSWFCQQEMLEALRTSKRIQLIVEREPRFHPFDIEAWEGSRGQVTRMTKTSAGDAAAVPKEICEMIDEHLGQAVTYRRRDFEVDAMMRELCRRSGLRVPKPMPEPWPDGKSATTVFVIFDADSGASIRDELRTELELGERIEFLDESADPASADRVLLLLTKGVLHGTSLDWLIQTIEEDARKGQDRVVAVYSQDKGWHFGCEEHKTASATVQAYLNDHEAIAFRARDPGGRGSHEFPAMVAQLGKNLGAGGGGASSVMCDFDVAVSDDSTVVDDAAEEASGPCTQSAVGARDSEVHNLQELLEALAANRAELAATRAELAANRAELTAKDAELTELRARVPSEGEPPV